MTTKAELLKRIRTNCINCFGGQAYEVPKCSSPKCQFYDFRMGKDPRPAAGRVNAGKASNNFSQDAQHRVEKVG